MILRTIGKYLYSSQSQIPFLNTFIKSYTDQLKSGIPDIEAFKSKLPQFSGLNEKEKDSFLRACINFSKDSTLSSYLKSEGYLSQYPALLIGCNTRHIIHTLNEFKQKEHLLKECQTLLKDVKDKDQHMTSERFVEEAYGDLYLPEGMLKEAIQHYLEALKIGNKYFEIVLKQLQNHEETMKSDQNKDKPNYHLVRAINIVQNLSQLSSKALFTNTKLNNPKLNEEIILNALYPYNRFPVLKVRLPAYFLIKKTEFNHRIIQNKEVGEAVYNDVLKAMEQVLQCLEVIEKVHPVKSLELLGIATINFATILNYLQGIKGIEADDNIKEVITTLCQGVTDAKKREEFERVLKKTASEMKGTK